MCKALTVAVARVLVVLWLAAGVVAAAGQVVTLDLELKNGELVGESNTFQFKEGDDISILWTSDKAVELHLHGYDLTVRAAPDAPGELRFVASSTGRFPVTTHGQDGDGSTDHHTLVYIEIHPR